MDILSQVVDALHLKSRATTRTAADAGQACRFDGQHSTAHVMLRGSAIYHPGGAGSGEALVAGDILLVNTPAPHTLIGGTASHAGRADAVWVTIEFHIDRASPHPLWSQVPGQLILRADEVTDHAELLRTVDLLETELINQQPGEQFIALRLGEITVVAALRRYQRCNDGGDGFLAALADPATQRALAAIHADPARRWSLPELARTAELSLGTFGERFHRLVGEPPMRYVRLWRLLTARRLIATTPFPISQVAQRAGYGSPGGFARAFRKQFGVAPSSLRRAP